MTTDRTGLPPKQSLLAVAGVMLITTSPALAQQLHPAVVAGAQLALRAPPAAFVYRDAAVGRLAVVEQVGGAVRIGGRADWQSLGLAPLSTVRIGSVTTESGSQNLLIHFVSSAIGQGTLSVPPADSAAILAALFAPAGDSVAVHAAITSGVQRRLFAGAMASVTPAGQAAIPLLAGAGYPLLVVDSLDGLPYLVLRTGESTYSCVAGVTSDPQRQRAALDEVALPVIRSVGFADPAMHGPFGFAVEVRMKSDYACGNPPSPDFLTLYVPAALASQLVAEKVTGSDVIAASVVTFNGHRVAAPAAAPGG